MKKALLLLAILLTSCSKDETFVEYEIPVWNDWTDEMIVGTWENDNSEYVFYLIEDSATDYRTKKLVSLYKTEGKSQVYADAYFHEGKLKIKDDVLIVTELSDSVITINEITYYKL
jgi:hypothetical protein